MRTARNLLTSALLIIVSAGAAFGQDGSWTAKADVPDPIAEHGSATIGDTLYLVGGRVDSACPATTTDTLAYIISDGTWDRKAPLSIGRHGLAVASEGGKLYAIGGGTCLSTFPTNEMYDPATNTWSTKASMPTPRQGHTVGVVNGILYAIGGQEQGGLPGVNLTIVEA